MPSEDGDLVQTLWLLNLPSEPNNKLFTKILFLFRNVGNGQSGREMKKFQCLKERILKEKDTLFYIVIDEGSKSMPSI